MKYIKKFNTLSAQTDYVQDAEISTYVGYVTENDTVYYDDVLPDYKTQYLTIKSLSDSNKVFFKGTTIGPKTISASTDNGETWTAYTSSENGTTIATLMAGDKLLLKGNNSAYASILFGVVGSNYFITTGQFNIMGNIMSLVSGDSFENADTLASLAFCGLFSGCTGLISAENLVLPATTLASNCYGSMFKGCTNLNHIKCLATDISASNCLTNWVYNVSPTGTFVKNKNTSWPTGPSGIPSGWTVIDAE